MEGGTDDNNSAVENGVKKFCASEERGGELEETMRKMETGRKMIIWLMGLTLPLKIAL